jgi:hypothetical protein
MFRVNLDGGRVSWYKAPQGSSHRLGHGLGLYASREAFVFVWHRRQYSTTPRTSQNLRRPTSPCSPFSPAAPPARPLRRRLPPPRETPRPGAATNSSPAAPKHGPRSKCRTTSAPSHHVPPALVPLRIDLDEPLHTHALGIAHTLNICKNKARRSALLTQFQGPEAGTYGIFREFPSDFRLIGR